LLLSAVVTLLAASCGSSQVGGAGSAHGSQASRPVSASETVVLTPLAGVDLTGLSCPSATSCVAVGWKMAGARVTPLGFRQHGSSWTQVPLPDPTPSAEPYPAGVSCAGEGSCFAVGTDEQTASTGALSLPRFVDALTGGTWHQLSVIPIIEPIGNNIEIACASSSLCIVPGYDGAADHGEGAASVEMFNSGRWRSIPAPAPIEPSAMSCPTSTSCFLVGYLPARAEIFRESGSKGGSSSSALFDELPGAELDAISCPAASVCDVLGDTSLDGATDMFFFIARLSGHEWSVPYRFTHGMGVGNPSCPSSTVCYAGVSGGTGQALFYLGADATSTLPLQGRIPLRNDLTCPSAEVCYATGMVGSTDQTVVVRIDVRWTGS
jgi:hypothetical protein